MHHISDKKRQLGRSMTEILAVLAVIGILSLGGIKGYNALQHKHQANEIISEISQRAISTAQKIALEEQNPADKVNNIAEEQNQYLPEEGIDSSRITPPRKDIVLNDFPQDTPHGKFSPKVARLNDDFFAVSVSGITKENCFQVKSATGKSFREVNCLENTDETYTAEVIFEKNLSETEGELPENHISDSTTSRSYNNDEEGCHESGYKYCPNGTCVVKTDVCPDKPYSCDNLLCDDGYYKEGCDCKSCGKGIKKCINASLATSCLKGYYLNENACVPCPENAYSCGDNDFTCQETYYKEDGKCVHCLNLFNKDTNGRYVDLSYEIDKCNATCFNGRYAVYRNTQNPQSMSITCEKLPSPQSIDTLTDKWLKDTWSYRGENTASKFNWQNMITVFGADPTPAELRSKLHDILDEHYIIPVVFGGTPGGTWFSAQSYCRAHRGTLVSYSDYFANNQTLGMAAFLIQGGYYTGNYGVFWANTLKLGFGWASGRSTNWQSGGSHSSPNWLYFLCKKN